MWVCELQQAVSLLLSWSTGVAMAARRGLVRVAGRSWAPLMRAEVYRGAPACARRLATTDTTASPLTEKDRVVRKEVPHTKISKDILLSTREFVEGREVIEELGVVAGSSAKSRSVLYDLAARVRGIFGGELRSYGELLNSASAEATRRLMLEAEHMQADAVVRVRYQLSATADPMSGVNCYTLAYVGFRGLQCASALRSSGPCTTNDHKEIFPARSCIVCLGGPTFPSHLFVPPATSASGQLMVDSSDTEELDEGDVLLLEAEYYDGCTTRGVDLGTGMLLSGSEVMRGAEKEDDMLLEKPLVAAKGVGRKRTREEDTVRCEDERLRKRRRTTADANDSDSDFDVPVAGGNDEQGDEEDAGDGVQEEVAGEERELVLDEEPRVAVAAAIASKLRPYQEEGVKFLYRHFKHGSGAILADDMGLGKTVQSIAFLSAIISRNDMKAKAEPMTIALLVTPASVISQWQGEVTRWHGELRVGKFHGNKGVRMHVLSQAKKGKFEAVLTSYETFRSEIKELNGVKWTVAMFDEAHRLKDMNAGVSRAAKMLLCRRRFGLTGTIMQNRLEELWNIVDWAVPGHLGSMERMRDKFINPIKFGQRIDASDVELAVGRRAGLELSLVVKEVVLRRDKTLIKHLLPEKVDQIVFCPLAPVQAALYKAIMALPEVALMATYSELCHCGSGYHSGKCHGAYTPDGAEVRSSLLPTINRLQKLACHPLLLLPNPKQKAEKQKKDSDFLTRVCDEEQRTALATAAPGDVTQLCGKLATMEPLMPVWLAAKHKVLVFSKSTRMLDILEEWMASKSYRCLRFDGSIPPGPKRQAIIDEFSMDPDIFVLLLSTGAGALGLNITAANIVVIFDPSWNASIDLQAQDRAFRLGQKKDCRIFRLIGAGTIEEAQYQRQLYKQQMQSISLEGKRERRLFAGVQGVQGQEGELFGISNLLKQSMDTCSIMDRNSSMEAKVTPDMTTVTATQEGGGGEMGMVLNTMDEDALKKELASIDAVMKAPRTAAGKASGQKAEDAVIHSLIAASGVEYSHRNDAVIGETAYEKQKSEQVHKDVLKGCEVKHVAGSSKVAPPVHVAPVDERAKEDAEKEKERKRESAKKNFQSKLDLMLKQSVLF